MEVERIESSRWLDELNVPTMVARLQNNEDAAILPACAAAGVAFVHLAPFAVLRDRLSQVGRAIH